MILGLAVFAVLVDYAAAWTLTQATQTAPEAEDAVRTPTPLRRWHRPGLSAHRRPAWRRCWPVTSLLDRPESTRAREFPRTRPRPLFHYAWRCVDDLATGSGWEAEYGRDARRLRKLRLGRNAVLRFDRIPQQTQSCNPPKRLS